MLKVDPLLLQKLGSHYGWIWICPLTLHLFLLLCVIIPGVLSAFIHLLIISVAIIFPSELESVLILLQILRVNYYLTVVELSCQVLDLSENGSILFKC